MTTPTNENRDPGRAEPEPRQRIDLSVTKIAAGATAAALAAAVGSKLGVAGTIAGAAVASVVSTSASTLIGHSLERGKSAARKAMPVLDPEQLETALLSRARIARAERQVRAANGAERVPMGEAHAGAAGPVDETVALPVGVAGSMDETVALPVGSAGSMDETMALPASATARTVVLPKVTPDAPRTWKDRVPGRKPLIAAAVASFMIGTGAVTALEVARKGEFPGYHSNVFTNDPGQSGGSHDQPAQQYPGGSDSTHGSSTPSQKPQSPSPTSSGSSSATPSTTPSTPPISGSTPSTPPTSSTSPSTGPTTPSTAPTTQPTGSPNPTAAPSTPGATTPSTAATGAGKATPTGGVAG